MITKTLFNEIISYLRCHPSEAQRLREIVLGKEIGRNEAHSGGQQNDEWLKAKEVAERVGFSPMWVKQRIDRLPPGTAEQRGAKGTWWINWTCTEDQFRQMKYQ